MANIPKDELKRKGIHLAILIYVIGYWYLPKIIIVLSLTSVIFTVALCEWLRFKFRKINIFFKNNFKGFYRPGEVYKISGLIGTLLGSLITILLFKNKYAVFTSFLYLIFGDSVAALVGRSVGKHKIMFSEKSLEGSLGCFITCFIVGSFNFNWFFALIGAIVATIVEAIPWKINDNFWMPIINAGFLTTLSNVMADYL
jgi:dolichol kinase